jgi:hypothetical protein
LSFLIHGPGENGHSSYPSYRQHRFGPSRNSPSMPPSSMKSHCFIEPAPIDCIGQGPHGSGGTRAEHVATGLFATISAFLRSALSRSMFTLCFLWCELKPSMLQLRIVLYGYLFSSSRDRCRPVLSVSGFLLPCLSRGGLVVPALLLSVSRGLKK